MMPILAAACVVFAQTSNVVSPAKPGEAKAYVDHMTVIAGAPFWFYIEAAGSHIVFPDPMRLEGFAVDPINLRRTTTVLTEGDPGLVREKRGYYLRARNDGLIKIPSVSIAIDGEAVDTSPVEIRAVPKHAEPAESREEDDAMVPEDDIIFIRLTSDRQQVYQGEGILLTRQLWLILDPRISAGPYREELNTLPTTEGFVSRELASRNFVAEQGDYTYEVLEDRLVLYPTQPGVHTIGAWHFEGIGLIRRLHSVRREKVYYALDEGPIPITVKALPRAPKGFSGAVGAFTLNTVFKAETVQQGVPVILEVTLDGVGNPDALGEPRMPELPWAHVGEPDRVLEVHLDEEQGVVRVIKRLAYAITPLRAGPTTIPSVSFVYFDPAQGAYQSLGSAPVDFEVEPNAGERRLIVTEELDLTEREITILGQDIRPLHDAPARLNAPSAQRLPAAAAVALGPMLLYGAAVALQRRRSGHAPAPGPWQDAPADVTAALREAEPLEALYRYMSACLAHRCELASAGVTADDASQALRAAGYSTEAADAWRKLLARIERERYGGSKVSEDTLAELEADARQCLRILDSDPDGGHA